MATTRLPQDFKEFLQLLNSHGIEYLLVGGHAVAYYGYPRPTGDLDIWVAMTRENAEKLVKALKEFGFDVPRLSEELFLAENQIVRMGVPPLRIDILTTISGIRFEDSFPERTTDVIEGVEVSIIGLHHLKANKQSSARHKDLDDLENLP